jgi:hypothetical protein
VNSGMKWYAAAAAAAAYEYPFLRGSYIWLMDT